jgi:hypothetical protein
MSLRIERADPLTLMRELPGDWAQTCVTRPPDTSEETLGVLAEVHRVLRDDGTLWLRGPHAQNIYSQLAEQGWVCQPLPACMKPLAWSYRDRVSVFLLTKRPAYFSRCHLLHPPRTHRDRACCVGVSAQARRAQTCASTRGDSPELVRRCVLVSTSIRACGACGAPYRQARPSERARGLRRATCSHNNPQGRCLVLDPFYEPRAKTAGIAISHERSFLAIHNPGTGENR